MLFKHAIHDGKFSLLQLQLVCKKLGLTGISADTIEIPDTDAFGLVVVSLLNNLTWLKPAQQEFLITELYPQIRHVQPPFDFQLCFCDGRYVTWTGRIGFLDLETGAHPQHCPAVFESVAYNLGVRMQQLIARSDKERQGCPPPETSG